MRSPTSLRRTVRVIGHLGTGAAISLILAAGRPLGWRPAWLPTVVRWWHARLCRALELRVAVSGRPAEAALLVGNHVSWLDVPVLGAQGEIGFLAKAEVRQWPLVGWMAEIAGTLFIARGANQTGALTERIGSRLRRNQRVAVFPEGTTTDGTRVARFHPRLFAAAARPGVWVQPVALRYGGNTAPDPVAPFVGDDDLLSHLTRLLRHPGLDVSLVFLPPFQANGLDRRRVAGRCRGAIAAVLGIDPVTDVPLVASADRSPRVAAAPDTPLGETA